MRYKRILTVAAACALLQSAQAQVFSFGEKTGMYSFEESVSPAEAGVRSSIALSSEHNKFGERSLKWEWTKPGSEISFHADVPYLSKNPNPKETSVSTFVFWIYSPEVQEGEITFTFMKDGNACCSFPFRLGFKGWRASWVAFDRDMKGTPQEHMDCIVVKAPEKQKKGTLYFDCLIPSAFQDVRYHTPDFQTPFVNENTTSHWLILNDSWNRKLDIPDRKTFGENEIRDLKKVEKRFKTIVSTGYKKWDIDKIRTVYDSYAIKQNPDGTITGKPVFFRRFAESFINLGLPDVTSEFSDNGQLLVQLNDNMQQFALSYVNSEDKKEKAEIEKMYIDLIRHYLDQGFAAGSGMGTLHHLGYSMRNFYSHPVLMKEVLKKHGLADEMQQAMEWFSGVGEVKTAPAELGIDIDAFNTSLMGRVASVIMLEDTPYKFSYMKAIQRWVDNGFKYTDGTRACFKTDGTVYHHRKAYPAYATGGFTGAVNAVWMFAGTRFRISEESHQNLKKALLEMRFYSNKTAFPLAMSGRHPDGKSGLRTQNYAILAQAGSPDRSQEIDKELAEAYLRLDGPEGRYSAKLMRAGFKPEPAPAGTKVYGYACTMSHRMDEWLVTFAGHSRYLWATETYAKANHYGRYITHGSMQIISEKGKEVSPIRTGFQVDGWDWCHFPGTTATEHPMEEMASNVLNVDEFSGYEEMLLSDEWFAGGVSHKGVQGAYAMKLHEHDKYNGSLRANKSFFAFGNRIIALGSDLENALENAELHTTLFQNTATGQQPTTVNGKKVTSLDYEETLEGGKNVLRDRNGNAYLLDGAKIRVSRKEQHSYHADTDKPTKGNFEKAYIMHGTVCGPDVKDAVDHYEYLTLIKPEEEEVAEYAAEKPYQVIRCDKTAHIVKDFISGTVACAAFDETAVDGYVLKTSPAMLMYSIDEDKMTLSVSNPDLALYSGPSDEKFDENGKRIERSVYSREWIDNPCGKTTVTVTLRGMWEVNAQNGVDVEVARSNRVTVLTFHTKEARTEEIILNRVAL